MAGEVNRHFLVNRYHDLSFFSLLLGLNNNFISVK